MKNSEKKSVINAVVKIADLMADYGDEDLAKDVADVLTKLQTDLDIEDEVAVALGGLLAEKVKKTILGLLKEAFEASFGEDDDEDEEDEDE